MVFDCGVRNDERNIRDECEAPDGVWIEYHDPLRYP